jgi:tetratricopeptide (TPR) repeat protein
MDRDRDGARAALARLAPSREARQAKAPTEREKMYLRAVETLYADGEKADRDLAYSVAMRDLHERFPQDADAACFYALSLLGTTEGVRDTRTYMRAAAILEDVFAKYPDHPGAVHYLIHSYDDPTHAPLGVRAASIYAKIAPAASHAQHMISHIYIALGDWNAVVDSNEKAVAVSEDRLRRRNEPLSGRSHHALSWLEYAYLQQGRFREARAKLDTMAEDTRANGSGGNRRYYSAMRAAYIIEMPDPRNVPPSLGGQPTSMDLFATGWSALMAGDLDAARKVAMDMRSLSPGAAAPSGSCYMAGMGTAGASRGATVDLILLYELEAAIMVKDSKIQEAQALLEKAAAMEEGMSFEFGPPDVPKPVREFLGEVFLEKNQPAEARQQFELALLRAPRRARSLLGEARAAAQSGDSPAAQRIYAELRRIWQHADAGFAPLQEVNRSLAAGNSPAKSQR